MKKVESPESEFEPKPDQKEIKVLVNGYLTEIFEFDEEIISAYALLGETEELNVAIDLELESQADYAVLIKSRLSNLISDDPEDRGPTSNVPSASPMSTPRLPELKCDVFSGEGTNHMDYFNFLTKFNNIVGNHKNVSNSTKLTYLRSFLRGFAFKIVQHLSVTDSNYIQALELLEVEFLNKPALVDDLLKKSFGTSS